MWVGLRPGARLEGWPCPAIILTMVEQWAQGHAAIHKCAGGFQVLDKAGGVALPRNYINSLHTGGGGQGEALLTCV